MSITDYLSVFWALVAVMAAVPLARMIKAHFRSSGGEDPSDNYFAAAFGVMAALGWPLTLIILLVVRFLTTDER